MKELPVIRAFNESSEIGRNVFAPCIFLEGCNLRCPYCMNAKLAQKDYTEKVDINYIKEYVIDGEVTSVHIDPDQKLKLDIDLNNNSYTFDKIVHPIRQYSWKTLNWLQTILQSISILM